MSAPSPHERPDPDRGPRLDLRWWLLRTVPAHAALGALVAWGLPRWPAPFVWGLLLWHGAVAVAAVAGWRWWRPYAVDVVLLLVVDHVATFAVLGLVAELGP
ncbi:MAG: hypothetical protein H6742_13660 [Alphaproteobacteria bacterium]|nr:hypothetical protein [Alphaproteobacteria bacterium]